MTVFNYCQVGIFSLYVIIVSLSVTCPCAMLEDDNHMSKHAVTQEMKIMCVLACTLIIMLKDLLITESQVKE
jgi:hypothetical protein